MTADFKERRIAARDGLKLYVRDYGDLTSPLPVLLCLGGIARNSKDFHDLAERQSARGFRVLSLDYRGRGQSEYDPNADNYRPETYLDDIRHLLTALNVHRVIAVGTSLGGFLAMGMGAAMPTLLAGAILNDAGPEIGGSGMGRILDYLSRDPALADWDEAVDDLKAMMPHLRLDEEGWRKAAAGTYARGPDGRLHYDWDLRITEPLRKGGALPDLWALFGSLRRVPTLALRGEISDLLPPDCFERMAAYKPDLIRVTVPDAGHVPTLSEPESMEAIDAFFERYR